MSRQADILSRFSGQVVGRRALYLPDLALWYRWHRERDTLPEAWAGYSLPQVARAMGGVPCWQVVRPWRVETPGVHGETVERDGFVFADLTLGCCAAAGTAVPGRFTS